MKKSKKICISVVATFLSIIQVTNLIPLISFAETDEPFLYTGECGADGDNVIWTYDVTTQTITFSGTGAMRDYAKDLVSIECPSWTLGDCGKVYNAKNLVFEEGITDTRTITEDFFGSNQSSYTITVPESVTSMDTSVMPIGVRRYGKYGSWFYYNSNPNYFNSTGIAENEYIPSSGISEAGFEWNFDYVTRILTINGTDAKNENDKYARMEIGLIFKYAKAVVIEKDFIPPADENEDAEYWGIAGSDYVAPIVHNTWNKPYMVYCYKDSDFANAYESLKNNYASDWAMLPNAYEGRVVYIDDPDEVTVGDLNMDGNVDLMDAIYLNKYTANIVQLTDAQKVAADCNGDGIVTDADVTTLMEFLILQVPSLPYTGAEA